MSFVSAGMEHSAVVELDYFFVIFKKWNKDLLIGMNMIIGISN